MKRLLAIATITMALASAAAGAQTFADQSYLANDAAFLQRVRQSILTQALAVSSDGLSTGINIKRHAQVQAIMTNPDGWKQLFAAAIVTQAAVNGPATSAGTVVLKPMVCLGQPTTGPNACTETGNTVTQGALVSDTVINTTVSAVFNSMFGGQ